MKQLDYVIEKCAAAMNAGIPVLYLETDDMSMLDELLRSERLLPYWYRDCDEGWKQLSDDDKASRVKPENVAIFNGSLSTYFKDVNNTTEASTYTRTSFVPGYTGFQYSRTGVRGGVPQVIAVRNYRPDDSTAKALERLVSEHLSAMPGDSILRSFIILQSPVVSLPAGLEPYVEVITVPRLGDDEVADIIRRFALSEHEECPYPKLLDSMTLNFRGFMRGKIEQMLRKILLECGTLSGADVEEVSLRIIGDEKKQMLQKSGLLRNRELGDKEASGLERIKDWIAKRKEIFENAIEAKRDWGLNAPKGVLVSGVPGTGKSLLAEETARILGIPLIQMDMGSLQSKYHGESEQNMRRLISLAEALSPCVLWIDEIEKAFAGVKGSGEADGGTTMRSFGTFLTWMQDKKAPCFIFATANDVSSLPPEFLRRGRFDRKFFTFMPTKEECRSIFRSIIGGRDGRTSHLFDPEIFTDEYLDELLAFCGQKGKFMTGADIEGIVDDAKFLVYLDAKSRNNHVRPACAYMAGPFKKALKAAVLDARTYGETDMDKVVECLMLLGKEQFVPSSATNVVDVSRVNARRMEIPPFEGMPNGYDELLYKKISETLDEIRSERHPQRMEL